MKKISLIIYYTIFIVHLAFAQQISDYNLAWNSPSHNSAGSMPLGNGSMGLNVWVEEDGDLLFYISRTDAVSEADRLLKLGRVRVHFSPNPFENNKLFKQTLLLNEGVIEIQADSADNQSVIRIYIDTSCDVAYLTYTGKSKRKISVTAESWRRDEHIISPEESASTWTVNPLPANLILKESADKFSDEKKSVSWIHANKGSQLYDLTMQHQDLSDFRNAFPDPISRRIFGARITVNGFSKLNDSTMVSQNAVNKAVVKIATHSAQVESEEEWTTQLKKIEKKSTEKTALANSQKWWSNFWNRSYIYIQIPDNEDFAYKLTQSYILQRYMLAGSGRGAFPIRFNGSIFTTDPKFTNSEKDFNPDFRNWGNCNWWQNIRLPYYAMFAAGDFDLMQPFFGFYFDRLPAFRTLAEKFYGAKGFFIPETVTLFGTFANGDYGWIRENVTPNDVTNEYIRFIWEQGLEFSKMALDYYSYAADTAFLRDKVVPTVREVLQYFDSRFIGKDGKMRISPTQSLETYWYEVTNDLPCIAGLHYLTGALKNLPEGCLSAEDTAFFGKIEKSLPPIPVKGSVAGEFFVPAAQYLNLMCNVENPELYAVFPYEAAVFADSLRETGILTFQRRINDLNRGWGPDGQTAAMLGLTDLLPAMLKSKIENTNSNHRFPAMWGPNFDWTPDQCHGGNLMLTLQKMVLQTYKGEDHILPAFPKDWKVKFKLRSSNGKWIERHF